MVDFEAPPPPFESGSSTMIPAQMQDHCVILVNVGVEGKTSMRPKQLINGIKLINVFVIINGERVISGVKLIESV